MGLFMQGDLLFMILYLFYNLDLPSDAEKGEAKVGYMDDVNFFAEALTFNEAYAKLNDMITYDGRGQDWSRDHNSRFEMSKLTLIGFIHRRVRDPAQLEKLIVEPQLSWFVPRSSIPLRGLAPTSDGWTHFRRFQINL